MTVYVQCALIMFAALFAFAAPARAQSESADLNHKCGTGRALAEYFEHVKSGKPILAAGPQLSDSLRSKSGRFTLHYTLAGPDATTLSLVEQMADDFDEAYELEIEQLKYPKPASSFSDSTYHVFIHQLGGYGLTRVVGDAPLGTSPSGLLRKTSYIEMDNDFQDNIFTRGPEAARITAFHEFHHVVQFAVYGVGPFDNYFQEMTSVWLEKRSTPQTKDYLQYLPALFSKIDLSFKTTAPQAPAKFYGLGIWVLYLQRVFGDDIIKRTWEIYSNDVADPYQAFNRALLEDGSTFCNEYKRFGTLLFLSGYRATLRPTVFEDIRSFPVDTLKSYKVIPGQATAFISFPGSLNYVYSGFGKDTVALVTASDSTLQSNASVLIAGPESIQRSYQIPAVFCDTVLNFTRTAIAEVFPQPFYATAGSDTLSFLVASGGPKPVSAYVGLYNMSMQEIVHFDAQPERVGDQFIARWDGKDAKGKKLGSGVYLYTIDTGDEKRTGKFVVIRR